MSRITTVRGLPPGCGSLQAECYYSKKYRPLDRRPEDCIEPVIADLQRCGVLRETDRIVHGAVTDFLQVWLRFLPWHIFNPWPTFNVADAAVTIGAILLVIDVLFFPQHSSDSQ